MNDNNFKIGITETFPCSYLPNEQERLLIALDERLQNNTSYSLLMSEGFRRSGEQSYRPYCLECHACKSIRVVINRFKASKSQKKSLKRNAHLVLKRSNELKACYFPLYEKYINTCHREGSMYPANIDQFQSFLSSKLTEQIFIETWHEVEGEQQLICVSVIDVLINALSAVYTFYHPNFKAYGLGVFSILTQVNLCKELGFPYLYLGYQIDDCKKMNYKNRYFPYQQFINGKWKLVEKTIKSENHQQKK